MRADPGFRRSHHAQFEAVRRDWPDFHGFRFGDGTAAWIGQVQPQAQPYTIEVFWNPRILDRPYVVVAAPPIAPRPGLAYEGIPHLMFNAKEPARSGLCLFDPAGREWTPADLLAETTIPWAAEWLHFYGKKAFRRALSTTVFRSFVGYLIWQQVNGWMSKD